MRKDICNQTPFPRINTRNNSYLEHHNCQLSTICTESIFNSHRMAIKLSEVNLSILKLIIGTGNKQANNFKDT